MLLGGFLGNAAAGPDSTVLFEMDEPKPAGTVTVLYEDFEGSFPGTWSVEDRDSAGGLDYWGTSAHRAFSGSQSAWAAAVGTQSSPDPEFVWSEDFEGAFPGSNWTVTDQNAASGTDVWGATTFRTSYNGLSSAWAAEVGDHSVLGQPNNAVHEYDNDMQAQMARRADLAGYGFGVLVFSVFLDVAWNDTLNVGYFEPTEGWVYKSYTSAAPFLPDRILVPGTATEIAFLFVSDGSGTREGAYVDDVSMYGVRANPLWSENFEAEFPGAWSVGDSDPTAGADYWGASSARAFHGSRSAWVAEAGDHSVLGSPNNVVRRYDNNMTAFMTRAIGQAIPDGAILSFWYWSDVNSFVEPFDNLHAAYFEPGRGWTDATGFPGPTPGWVAPAIFLPPTATEVGFFFGSDWFGFTEGAYLDTIALYAIDPPPNAAVKRYDNSMNALMSHTVDLTSLSDAKLEYAYWTDTQLYYDWMDVVYSEDNVTWWFVTSHGGDSGGWVLANTTIPTTARYIGFLFYSESSMVREGAYVDEVRVTGTAPDLACTASVSTSAGTEGQTSFELHGNASGGVTPYDWSWAFGDGGSSVDQDATHVYPVGGTFAPSLTVTDDVGQSCVASVGTVTVSHRGPLTVLVSPAAISVDEGASATFTAAVRDGANHDLTAVAAFTWSVSPPGCGTHAPSGPMSLLVTRADAGGMSCTISVAVSVTGLLGSGAASLGVLHAGPLTVTIAPDGGAIDEGGARAFTATARDAKGHNVTGTAEVTWSVSPAGCASLSASSGASTTFTAARGSGGSACTVTAAATLGDDEGSASVVVTVRAGVSGLASPVLILLLIVVIVGVFLLLARRRRGRPGPRFGDMESLESTSPRGDAEVDRIPSPPEPPPEEP